MGDINCFQIFLSYFNPIMIEVEIGVRITGEQL